MSETTRVALRDLTVVIPVRNAAAFIESCLESALASSPAEVVVVDGRSTDATLDIARRFPVRILDDGGRGVAAARLMGAGAASTVWVALVDVDVLLPPGALAALLDEAVRDGYTALQAGLESTSGPGYWGRALVDHHRSGLSKHWFGLVATVIRRDSFLSHGLDVSFASGEDIEMRFRMERSGEHIGVSDRTIVPHRFGDTFEFARGQFLADGAGLARMAVKHGWRAAPLLALPAAAAVRGTILSLVRGRPQWVPYYATFLALNWFAMGRQLLTQVVRRRQ
ncbi:MAG: glycosyltransferase [Chloroflexota bacterium]|nr:glycosyltransferase [Chloroflexota bacterium]